jgi:hypothetical protein
LARRSFFDGTRAANALNIHAAATANLGSLADCSVKPSQSAVLRKKTESYSASITRPHDAVTSGDGGARVKAEAKPPTPPMEN